MDINSKKIKLGGVFKLETSIGKAFVHYIYNDKELGYLIRVLPGVYKDVPKDINKIISLKEDYMVFFALPISIKMSMVKLLGYYPINGFKKPQYMRTKHFIPEKLDGWDIVNTDTWARQFIDELGDKQKKLSPWGIWSAVLLKERIENGWKLENWI